MYVYTSMKHHDMYQNAENVPNIAEPCCVYTFAIQAFNFLTCVPTSLQE